MPVPKQPDVWLIDTLKPYLAAVVDVDVDKFNFYPQIEVAENMQLDLPSVVYIAGNDEQIKTFRTSHRDCLYFALDFRACTYKDATRMLNEAMRVLRQEKQSIRSRVKGSPQSEFQTAMPVSMTGGTPVYVRSMSCVIRYFGNDSV